MIKLLIADDEPLVQIGIQSMLDWRSLGIELCTSASNGEQAYQLIQSESPDIVITDIKMPIMNGLELIEKTRRIMGRLPLFLILTSYEEFSLIKKALSYQVVDYLVKLELDAAILGTAITRTIERLREIKQDQQEHGLTKPLLFVYHDKFFIRLLHNLFDSSEQFQLQANDLSLHFNYACYITAHCEIHEQSTKEKSNPQLINLYNSTIQMVRDILNKHIFCHVISLDMQHFAVIFCIKDPHDFQHSQLTKAIQTAAAMVHNYFNVWLSVGIGSLATQPMQISESYQNARRTFRFATYEQPIIDGQQSNLQSAKNAFNITVFKNDITKAFEEFDTDVLNRILTEIMELFQAHPLRYIQAMDGASNILYLAISMLPEGEKNISHIFSHYSHGYRTLYQLSNVEQIVEWLGTLRDGLCSSLLLKRVTYKEHVIHNVQKYIQANIEERLTLNQVAGIFGLSPNYLSVLFKKSCGTGFSEYINQQKITRAKLLLLQSDLKIYEIADQLGFDNAFYFSKVFKKITGLSPRDFVQTNTIPPI